MHYNLFTSPNFYQPYILNGYAMPKAGCLYIAKLWGVFYGRVSKYKTNCKKNHNLKLIKKKQSSLPAFGEAGPHFGEAGPHFSEQARILAR